MTCPNKKTWAVRLRPALHEEIKKIASNENRSINSVYERLLASAVGIYDRRQASALDRDHILARKHLTKSLHGKHSEDRQLDKAEPSHKNRTCKKGRSR